MVDAILADGSFAARAVTKNSNSDAAKDNRHPSHSFCFLMTLSSALAARGVEVVQGDLNDPASLEKAYVTHLYVLWSCFSLGY
jgi:uncharacterized protein YbjT (DUF2867 family)